MEISKALENLRKGKKRKFVQTLDIIVNLQNFDVRKEALNTFVNIPHSGGEKEIGAFLTKRSKLVDTITEEDFVKYKELKDMKKLAKKYDFFIAVAPMMAKVATKFGRVFGPMSKMPSPQAGIMPKETNEEISAMLEKMNKVVRVKNKEASIKLPIGREDMSDDQLRENIQVLIRGLKEKLPRGNDNLKEILIKFTMTKPEKIFEASSGKEQGKK